MLGRPPGPPSNDILVDMGEIKTQFAANKARRHKADQLRWSYGVSIEQWERLYREQDGKCAICGLPPGGDDRRTNSLHLDHDHETGEVRRLLCHYCNLGLGAFKDDPALLIAAAEYLRRYKKLGLVS